MTRPAVIIGLGGTGQWVTTYVKKELLEDNGGKMPSNVRLLCFDTWPDANVGGTGAAAPEVVSIGTTKLDLNVEFIPLSGDTFAKGIDVVEGRAPHLGRRISDVGEAYAWFDAPYFRQHVPQATWQLNIGAGQIRQFGRLGFFNHATTIKQHIANAFSQIKNANPTNESTQVMVIASFAGGTGAGMLIDLAVMARALKDQLGQGGGMFRGIFVLPGAFLSAESSGAHQMRARAYAAWRELARFMNLGPDYGAHSIRYDSNTMVDVKVKPFDQVFLVDANRSRHSFTNVKPENGIFPSIATFISTALDDAAGADLGNAVNQIQDLFNKKLGFSTFGAYSIQLPISHAITEYALQLDRDLLLRWLAPRIEVKQGNPSVTGLQPDQNLQKAGERGSQELKPFMTMPRHKLEAVVNRSLPGRTNPTHTLDNIPALASIYNLYEAFITGLYKGKVEQDALGGYCAPGADKRINPASWLGRMLLPEDHDKTLIVGPDGQRVAVDMAQLESEVNSTVRGAIPTSRDGDTDPTEEESNRIIKSVENDQNGYIVKHYGVGGGRGTFDEELGKLVAFHSERFKQLLEIELLNLLNGTVDDPNKGFTGRLGYVEDFCDSLLKALEWFKTQHLHSVKIKRGESNYLQGAKDTMAAAREEMAANAGRKCLVFFNHPRAHIKQEEYLEEVQNYCEVLKDEKLFFALERMSGMMKDVTAQALERVRSWANVLVVSPNSLYAQVLDEYVATRDDLDNQIRANQAQSLQLLRKYPTADVTNRIDDQMKRLRWTTKLTGSFDIGCEVFLEDEFKPLLNTADAHGHNKKLITALGRLAWENFANEHILLEEIGRPDSPNFKDPVALANELIARSEPMYVSEVPGAGTKTAMRRASAHTNDPAFRTAAYIDQIDGLAPTITPPLDPQVGYIRSSSSNHQKLALIQWVDRLEERHFKVYESLRTSYRKLIQGGDSHETASRLHIFPAEGNASFYEHLLPTWLQQPVREFSPRVVLLMTDVEKVRLFFHCYAIGLVQHGRFEGRGGRWWRLVTPAAEGTQAQNVLFYRSESNNIADPFEVISGFVRGVDELNNNLIVWDALRISVHQAVQRLKKNNSLKAHVDAQFGASLGNLPSWISEDRGLTVDPPMRFVDELANRSQEFFNDYTRSHGDVPEYNPGWTWVRNVDYKDLADVARMMYIELLLVEGLIRQSDLPNSHYR